MTSGISFPQQLKNKGLTLEVTDTLKHHPDTDRRTKFSQVLRNLPFKFPEIYQNRYYYHQGRRERE